MKYAFLMSYETQRYRVLWSFYVKSLHDLKFYVCSLLFLLQLYELSDDTKRKDFLDDLFAFMQKRGKWTEIY